MEMTGTKTTALAVAALAVLPLIGVRGAFATPYTSQVKASVNGLDQRIGDVKVADAYVVAPAQGAPSLRLALQEAPYTPTDTLTAVRVDTTSGPVSPAGLPIPLPAGQVVNLTATGSVGLQLPTASDRLPIPGADATVTLAFKNAGTVSVQVPVVSRLP